MKTIKFIIAAVILSGLMFACNQKPNEIKVPEPIVKTLTQMNSGNNLMSKDSFNVWKGRWNTGFRGYMANDSLFYFDMPLADLRDILNESNADTARFYLGMDSINLPHLMLVGVDEKGTPDFNIIADYTKVCPPYCTK